MSNVQKILIWSDIQYPYLDKPCDEAVNELISDWQPDIAVLNGDGIDFPTISHFEKDDRMSKFSDDVAGYKEYLQKKDRLIGKKAQKHYNAGNHEDRLRKYMNEKASELVGLEELEIPNVLGVREMGWGYTPYYDPMDKSSAPGLDINGLLVTHGYNVSKHSGQSARASFEKFGGSGVMGHTHRLGAYYHTNYRGNYVWLEAGCLCVLNPFYTVSPDWQNGIVAGYIYPDEHKKESRFDIRQVPIVHGKMVFEGKRYG